MHTKPEKRPKRLWKKWRISSDQKTLYKAAHGEGSIMEKATNAIYRELVPRLNEFVECRVQPDYSRMGTPVICAKLSLVRPERKRDNG